MKILFITQLSEQFLQKSKIINDIVSDMTLHGLKEVYSNDVVDYPGAWYMYKDEVKKRSTVPNLWGNGFTYYDSFENYESIDRSDIQNKIKKPTFYRFLKLCVKQLKFFSCRLIENLIKLNFFFIYISFIVLIDFIKLEFINCLKK